MLTLRDSLGLTLSERAAAAVAVTLPFSNHATLSDDLVSYWKLDETSGDRADSVGSNTLTDNNTVLYANTGPQGVVAQFTAANTEYLSVADNASLDACSGTGGFTLVAWVKRTTQTPAAKDSGGVNREWLWYTNGTFYVYQADATAQEVATGLTTDAEWHFYALGWDPADGKVFASKDGAAKTLSTGTLASVQNTTQPITLGCYGAGSEPFGGNMAMAGLYSRALGSADITSLYNSGLGKSYADLTTAEKVSLVSYWNLDETSGNRADSHGANTLTDNNTVTSSLSGPSGVVANFTAANSEYLTKTSFVAPDSYTITGWFNVTSTAGNESLISAIGSWADGVQFSINFSATNRIELLASDTDGVYKYADAGISGGPTLAVGWHFFAAWFDTADKIVHCSVDNFTTDSLASAIALPGTPYRTACTLKIAADRGYPNGKMANLGLWSRVLTANERTSILNSGIGKRYADLTTAEKVGLVSYWNLDEASGNRADSAGSNTLTDNNTVTSVINAGGAMRNTASLFSTTGPKYFNKASVSGYPDWTVSGWIKMQTSAEGAFMSLMNGSLASNTMNMAIYAGTTTSITVEVGDGTDRKSASKSGLTAGAWYLLQVWYDSTDKKVRIAVNDGAATASVALVGTLYTTAGSLEIGRVSTNYYSNATIDEVGWWSRVLTAQERTDLYNSGAGLFY